MQNSVEMKNSSIKCTVYTAASKLISKKMHRRRRHNPHQRGNSVYCLPGRSHAPERSKTRLAAHKSIASCNSKLISTPTHRPAAVAAQHKCYVVSFHCTHGGCHQVSLLSHMGAQKCRALEWKRKLQTPQRKCLRRPTYKHLRRLAAAAPASIDTQLNYVRFAAVRHDCSGDHFAVCGERELRLEFLPSFRDYSDYCSEKADETGDDGELAVATEVDSNLMANDDGKSVAANCKNANEGRKYWDERAADNYEQNRIIGNTQANNKSTIKNATSKVESHTELQEISNNNNINAAATQADKTAAPAASLRTNSGTSSPLSDAHHGKKTSSNTAVAPSPLEKKAQAKAKSARKLPLHQQQQHSSFEAATPATQSTEYLDAAELKQLKLLNRHSCNGRLDYESLEKHLEKAEELKAQQQQQDKTVEALSVMLQYLAHDMDAFSCPAVKRENFKSKDQLAKAMHLLDEAKTTQAELQEQLQEKEAYYTGREEELQALHRCELDKVQIKLGEYEIQAKAKIAQLELKLTQQDAENKQTQNDYRLEMERKLAQKSRELAEAEERAKSLESRLQALMETDQTLREKMISSENTHAERLQSALEREQHLNARVKELTAELGGLREKNQIRERELREKLNLTQEEVSLLRSSNKSLNDSLDRSSLDRSSLGGLSSPRNSNQANALELARLHSEAESLRYVLELKQKETFKLKRENEELNRDANERAALQAKISLLESKHEMLQSELEIKSEKEKELERQLESAKKALSHENTKRTRLSHDNEALQWQLKQRSEQLHLVEAKLQELSAHESFSSQHSNSYLTPTNRSSQLRSYQMEDISPPASPDVKSVIEKPHAVSWVLEIDDDTPETAAQKMVKRAGSFRAVERSPSMRRQLSVGANAVNGSVGPNPLSQSMSAASVIRQHSSEPAADVPNRLRSKSVCIKEPESACKGFKKLGRQSMGAGSSRKHELASPAAWKEPMLMTSSPYQHMRARTSTMKSGKGDTSPLPDELALFTRTKKLITCDTSSLNTGERLEMGALPSQTHDLKLMKKWQQIQESAGEAMVSGTNSEDEGCSASSDDIVSSASASTGTTGSNSSLNNLKNSHMSLDEALLIERIENPSGTPMEVSWCEDGDGALLTNASV